MKVWMPPEWHPQRWLWIGFPVEPPDWFGLLEEVQSQIAGFANAVADSGQDIRLVVRDEAAEAAARRLVGANVSLHRHAYGDIWLRDTGPLVVRDAEGNAIAKRFGFNGWGGKYEMDGDRTVGAALATEAALEVEQSAWVLEGGAIDTDGTGLVVTTEQCLLNPNRNPQMSRADIETRLERDLGFERVLWLGDGLLGDHTDGHVDNLARFVAPGVLAVPFATDADDPNAAIYDDARARAKNYGLEVREIPSPGRFGEEDAEPASYMNFVVTSKLVVVPTYGTPNDAAGIAAIAACFPDRETIGLPADAVLAGGGSFHCCSQHMPRL